MENPKIVHAFALYTEVWIKTPEGVLSTDCGKTFLTGDVDEIRVYGPSNGIQDFVWVFADADTSTNLTFDSTDKNFTLEKLPLTTHPVCHVSYRDYIKKHLTYSQVMSQK